ncbi:uncharacterized protein KIAA1671 homolog isoform X1 [Nannospalax galili]|uniref:uncharacterized protein KIAA1671 homolog isoform X1 n=1 Tax=Nannospalax galili TaxID=1026970 RepID=UPI0004ED4435|nr:uncharacterized protein KIAA1671 homolog isoform X1 [Nannospalax galili]XP_029409882.1 uncharacterized protein KIAA1671 homolog isoform X1 [Nannospalax galili]
MATRVEVGSMTSLRTGPSLGDISKEETLKRTYFWQAGDTPGAPSTHILEGKSPLRTSTCLFPLPTLPPKPVSKEQGPEGKAPASALWPCPTRPCPSTAIDKEAREDFCGKMPTLARQEVGSGEVLHSDPSLPSKTTFPRPGPSTVVLFESTKAGPTLGRRTSEGTREVSTQVAQDPPFSTRPEVVTKPSLPARKPPGTLPRPASLSQNIRSTASQEEAGRAQPLSKAGSVEDPSGCSVEPRPHPKRRPVSAVFSESLQPPKPGPGGVGEKVPPTPPEKTWMRKPRPLSMDLTAPFENKEALLKKIANEQSTAGLQGSERASIEPKGDAEGSVHKAIPGDPDSHVLEVTKKHPEWKKMLFKQKTESPTSPGGWARVTSRDDQSLQEEKGRPDQQSEKVPESPMPRPGRSLGLAEVKDGGSDWETLAGTERRPIGSIRNRLSMFGEENAAALEVASEPIPATSESPSMAPEPERAGMNVQARIKVWDAEGTEGKLEIKRKVPPARPVSADMTKLFSSSASSSEARNEKCAVLGGKLPGERREKPKESSGLDGGPSPRSLWKPVVPQKSRQTEQSRQTEPKDASNEDPDRYQGAHTRGDSGPSEITPEDDGSFQKVWATVFEHHVERHTVADQAGCCLPAIPPGDVTDTPQPRPRPKKDSWLEKDPAGVTNPRRESHRCSNDAEHGTLLDVEPRQYPTPVLETHPPGKKRNSCSFLKHTESPPVPQRIEPKYDFVHAEGKCAHSEAVSPPVEKAVLLRSRPRLSLQGWQLSGHTGAVHRASLIWETRGRETSGPKLDLQESRDMFGDSCPSPKWTGGAVASWQSATVVSKASTPERGPAWDGPPDPPSRANSEPCDVSVQAGLDTLSLQKSTLLTSKSNARLVQMLESETRMRRPSPSEPRLDRWRRRTLPHDVKFDVFSVLTPESTPRGQQSPPDESTSPIGALKKPPLSPHQAQTQEVTTGASQSRALPAEKPGLSTEPTATFFAVTYQIPDVQKAKSIVKSGPENFREPSRKILPPPLPHSSVSTLTSPSCDESQAPASIKNLFEGRECEEARNSLKHPKVIDRPSPVGDMVLDFSRDRIVNTLQIHRESKDQAEKDSMSEMSPGSRDALETAPILRTRSKASTIIRRRTEVISGTFSGKMRDGSRSNILDIDALMAQYKEQLPRDLSKVQEWKNSSPAEPSSSSQEKPGKPGEAEWGWRDPKEGPQAENLWKSVGASEKTHRSTPGSSKQLAEPPRASVTTKSGLPLWAPPPLVPVENHPAPSPAPAGPRKNSPGIYEHENNAFVSEYPGANVRHGPARSQDPGNSIRMSVRSSPSDQKKDTPRRSTGWRVEGSGAQWGDPPGDCAWSPLTIKRTCSDKGPPARVQEGLSAMQDARKRRQEQPRERLRLPTDPKATVGSCWRELRMPDGPKVPLQSLERGDGLQGEGQLVQQVCPVVPAPPSHSFCKDKKSGLSVDQLKQCFSRRVPEAKDTDTLVQEADSQYGTWADPRQSEDSVAPESPSPDSSASSARRQPTGSHLSSLSSHTEPTSADQRDSSRDRRNSSVDRSSSELESTDGPEGPPDTCPAERRDDFSFIHQTPVLDSSALKTRVQLSKQGRRRAPISHALRRSRCSESESQSALEKELDSMWMFKDSTEEKLSRRDDSDEEPSRVVKIPVSHPHRMPMFPGMDPGVLKAQLHKRSEVDSPSETLSWAPQLKTPKSPFQPGVLGSRVLPSSTEEERSEEPSPQWLKELKFKKRQSLYENQA